MENLYQGVDDPFFPLTFLWQELPLRLFWISRAMSRALNGKTGSLAICKVAYPENWKIQKKYTQNCQIIFNRYNNQHFFWIKHSVITLDLKEKKKKRRISHRHIPVKRKKKNRPLCFYYNVKRWKGIIIHDPIKEFCPVFFCGTRKVQQSLYRFSFALFSNKTSQLSINRNVVHCFSSLVLVIRF